MKRLIVLFYSWKSRKVVKILVFMCVSGCVFTQFYLCVIFWLGEAQLKLDEMVDQKNKLEADVNEMKEKVDKRQQEIKDMKQQISMQESTEKVGIIYPCHVVFSCHDW